MLTGRTISGTLVRVSYVTSELEVPFFRFQPNMVVTRQKSMLTLKVVESRGNWSRSCPCRYQKEIQKRPPGSKKCQKVAI